MKKIPILIDTDPGVDDFFCLAVGCAFKDKFNLVGVSAMGGNNYTEVTTQNALNILHLFNRDEVDVAMGEHSFSRNRPFHKPVAKYHGKNGLGDVEIEKSPKAPHKLNAYDFIYEKAKEYKGELVIVAVGPETNIAKCIEIHPDVTKLIKKFVIMGGSSTKGNCTPYAEANIFNDPYAAEIIFNSGVPIDMIGLNVTMQSRLNNDDFSKISSNVNPKIKNVMEALIAFRPDKIFHDCIAIGSLINDLVIFKDAYVYIETKNPIHFGQTVCDFNSDKLNVRVAEIFNQEKYLEMLDMMLDSYRI